MAENVSKYEDALLARLSANVPAKVPAEMPAEVPAEVPAKDAANTFTNKPASNDFMPTFVPNNNSTDNHAIIQIQDVTKRYGDFCLGPINLSVNQGKIMGLLGENGAGKTTLLSIVLRRILPDTGKVFICDDNINDKVPDINQDIMQDVGFVMDCADFHGNLTLNEIRYYTSKIFLRWDDNYFYEMVSHFKLDKDKKIDDMSRGTKTKAMLCIALAHHPKVLVFDEVTSGLDPSVRQDILSIIRQLVEQTGVSVLFSTHIISDIEKIADTVCLLHAGKICLSFAMGDAQKQYEAYGVKNLEDLMLDVISNRS
ncbi:MAG: ATP-binding cassette domain-containing protein [Coriobacteriales bacterium]|jgi:ABC-2 type transport system ATP-binding protein|nr:ATP-binding cassette domain-containing protein [Coriobacteriales bacterium]